MTAEEIIGKLEEDPLEQLKWLVLHEFGVLPGSKAAKEPSDGDFIMCGAHMVLDRRRHHSAAAAEGELNGSFDEERFLRLSEVRL